MIYVIESVLQGIILDVVKGSPASIAVISITSYHFSNKDPLL